MSVQNVSSTVRGRAGAGTAAERLAPAPRMWLVGEPVACISFHYFLSSLPPVQLDSASEMLCVLQMEKLKSQEDDLPQLA